MSGSLTVLCPNGHRVKVSTTPNMSLLTVKEIACSKKGYDPSVVELRQRGKKLDISSTVRFSGISNNATLDLEELSAEEVERLKNTVENVSVCLQTETERYVEDFKSTTSLREIFAKWEQNVGERKEAEVPVMVYMRQEIVGEDEMQRTSLRSLGLTKGRGLFRFFYKQPEVLKTQANVYDMKEKIKEAAPEKAYVPMRIEPEKVKYEESKSTEVVKSDEVNMEFESQEPLLQTTEDGIKDPDVSSKMDIDGNAAQSLNAPSGSQHKTEEILPDSTSNPIINPVGPNGALVFFAEGPSSTSWIAEEVLDDNFFDLSLDEVKSLYKDLKSESKRLDQGEMLMTKQMKEATKEGEKLSLLARYKSGLLRIQLPSRHIVQGKFPPTTTVAEVLDWLQPVMAVQINTVQLYMTPPRTVLSSQSTLLDLGLFPAALVHLSLLDTTREDVAGATSLLKEEVLACLSNIEGANQEAQDFRRAATRKTQKPINIGISGSINGDSRKLTAVMEEQPSTSGSGSTATEVSKNRNLPKWFKPGK